MSIIQVTHTCHVLHVGNLHMSCVRTRGVQYVGHLENKILVHTSLLCPVSRLDSSHVLHVSNLHMSYNAHACCPVCRSHKSSTNTTFQFTRSYHVHNLGYTHTGHVLHVGNLYMSCVRMRGVKYVGYVDQPLHVGNLHMSLRNQYTRGEDSFCHAQTMTSVKIALLTTLKTQLP